MSGPIVLGYDDSVSANAALAKTINLAGRLQSKVIVVFGSYVTPLGGQGGDDMRQALERVGNHALGRAKADLEAAGIEVETRIVEHKPAEAILQVATEAGSDLIVVGTVGEHPITGAILGSVVLWLVQRSTVPLLVVPTSEDHT